MYLLRPVMSQAARRLFFGPVSILKYDSARTSLSRKCGGRGKTAHQPLHLAVLFGEKQGNYSLVIGSGNIKEAIAGR
jgi:hypothetical protein